MCCECSLFFLTAQMCSSSFLCTVRSCAAQATWGQWLHAQTGSLSEDKSPHKTTKSHRRCHCLDLFFLLLLLSDTPKFRGMFEYTGCCRMFDKPEALKVMLRKQTTQSLQASCRCSAWSVLETFFWKTPVVSVLHAFIMQPNKFTWQIWNGSCASFTGGEPRSSFLICSWGCHFFFVFTELNIIELSPVVAQRPHFSRCVQQEQWWHDLCQISHYVGPQSEMRPWHLGAHTLLM